MNARAWSDGGGNTGYPCACAAVVDIDTPALDHGSAVTTWHVAERLPRCSTNNEAEYEGVLLAMDFALENSVKNLMLYTDSRLVRNHILGRQPAKDQRMKNYLEIALSTIKRFDHFVIEWVPRTANKEADRLCREVLKGDSDAFRRIFTPPPKPRPRPPVILPLAPKKNPFAP